MAEVFSRREREHLRQLVAVVREAETRELLATLDAEFSRWKQGECTSSELLDEIHDFHQNRSRHLWTLYQYMDAPTALGRGLSLGLITEREIPPGLRAKLVPWARPFEKREAAG